jgi:hypothetical protein
MIGRFHMQNLEEFNISECDNIIISQRGEILLLFLLNPYLNDLMTKHRAQRLEARLLTEIYS